MVLDPGHHATEGPTRLAIRVDVLLLVVEVRVVDARGSRDQEVDIPRHRCQSTIRRGAEGM